MNYLQKNLQQDLLIWKLSFAYLYILTLEMKIKNMILTFRIIQNGRNFYFMSEPIFGLTSESIDY